MTDNEKFFGRRLKEIRKENGLSQAELAERLSVDEKYISRLETGSSTPSFSMLNKLSKALNTEVENLFKFKHYKKTEELIKIINSKIQNTSEKNIRLIYKIIEDITNS